MTTYDEKSLNRYGTVSAELKNPLTVLDLAKEQIAGMMRQIQDLGGSPAANVRAQPRCPAPEHHTEVASLRKQIDELRKENARLFSTLSRPVPDTDEVTGVLQAAHETIADLIQHCAVFQRENQQLREMFPRATVTTPKKPAARRKTKKGRR